MPGIEASHASPTIGGWPLPSLKPKSPRRIGRTPSFDAHQDDPEFGYRYLADEADAAGPPHGGAYRVAAVLGQRLVLGLRIRSRPRTASGQARRSMTTCASSSMPMGRLGTSSTLRPSMSCG